MIACFDMDGARQEVRKIGAVKRGARDPFACGAPALISPHAPQPALFPPGRSSDEIVELFARKTRHREEEIARIIERGRSRGAPVERFVACISYDTELAPWTTNRRQLLELGIAVPSESAFPDEPSEIHRALWTVIYGLARLGIYLTGTNHLNDTALLYKLCLTVLNDEVRDVPPSADVSEFIDLGQGAAGGASGEGLEEPAPDDSASEAKAPPDGLFGPFDFGSEVDEPDGGEFRVDGGPCASRDQLLPRPLGRGGPPM